MKVELIEIKPKKSACITDRIKTIENAFAEYGITDNASIEVSDNLTGLLPLLANFTKAAILTSVLNDGWKPDWNNGNEKKWMLYFDMRTQSFSLNYVDYCYGSSFVPSCLCFRDEKTARYAYSQFPELYKSLFTSTI